MIAEKGTVIRNGLPQFIPSEDIVVGDIVLLSCIRIVEVSPDLHFDRSLLTGERFVIVLLPLNIYLGLTTQFKSYMISGTVDSTSENAMETRNLALNSTIVVQGKYTGVVFATGDKTIMGRIVNMSGDVKF